MQKQQKREIWQVRNAPLNSTALYKFRRWGVREDSKVSTRRSPNTEIPQSDRWLLLQILEEQRGRGGGCTSPHCCKSLPLQLKWLPGDLKGYQSFLFPFIFPPFPFWEPDLLKTRTLKAHVHRRKKKLLHTPKETFRLKKIWEDLKFISQADPQERENLQQLKKKKINKQKQNPANRGEGRESWLLELPHY